MEEEFKRDFKGVWIPKEIYLDDRLNALEKILLAEIDSLDNDETGCIAGNNYLAEFCKCTETKVSIAIAKFKELGYVEQISFDGRHRVLKIKRQTLKNLKADIKKIKAININNNIDINKEKNIKKEKVTLEEIENYIAEKNLNVDGKQFFDYFEEGNWIDSKGNKVKNWKQKLLTWNKYADKKQVKKLEYNYTQQKEDLSDIYEN